MFCAVSSIAKVQGSSVVISSSIASLTKSSDKREMQNVRKRSLNVHVELINAGLLYYILHTKINEDICVWLLCPHTLQDVHVSVPALRQRVAVIRLDRQGLQALRIHLLGDQGRVRVHQAGRGVAGT